MNRTDKARLAGDATLCLHRRLDSLLCEQAAGGGRLCVSLRKLYQRPLLLCSCSHRERRSHAFVYSGQWGSEVRAC